MNIDKGFKWCNEHLISNPTDIQFIQDESKNHKQLALHVNNKKGDKEQTASGSLRGKIPTFCLIHTLTENDDIKQAFLKRHIMAPGQLEIENWKSADREKAVWEQCQKYGTAHIAPTTKPLPDLQSDFAALEVITIEKG